METPEFIPPQLWSSNLPDLNPVDNSVWETLQEVYKTCTTDLELSTTPLTDGCHNDGPDPAWSTPFSVAVSVRPDQRCIFLVTSCNVSHTLLSTGFKSGKFEDHN